MPQHFINTFLVNGILIAAGTAKQPQLAVMAQCLDLLHERDLAWNATTWRQVFRLQVSTPTGMSVAATAVAHATSAGL